MLDAPELAKRLCAAMDYHEPVKIRLVDLAEKLNVSKQAVYEWRTTGRIAKGRLLELAAATDTPVEYWLEAERGSSKTTRSIWARFGKAFAKAAVFALLALNLALQPSYSDAKAVFVDSRLCVYFVQLRKAMLERAKHWLERLSRLLSLFTLQKDVRINPQP